MKLTKISEFAAGEKVQGFFLCKEKHLRHTRAGDLYLDLVLQDASGAVYGKVWDLVNDFKDRFQQGEPVAVKGVVTEYNGEIQLTISQINLATVEQYGDFGFALEQLFRSIPEPVDELWEQLLTIINELKNPYLKTILTNIFTEYQQKIQSLPGSIDHHDPLRGGLLKHIVSTGKIAVQLTDHYRNLNSDLIITGALLHDIGKVLSMENEFEPEYSTEGQIIGHLVLGRDIVLREIAKIDGFPHELKQKLEHILLAHQGFLYRGSPVLPKFPEALLVYYIDEMDSKLEIMMRTIKEDPDTGEWTNKRNIFHTQLWKR